MFQSPVPGRLSLAEQELKCGEIQNSAVCKLVHMSKMGEVDGVKFNLAVFVEVDIGDDIPPPEFVRVPPGGSVATIIADQLAQQRVMIFDEIIFASNQEARVMGFQKIQAE